MAVKINDIIISNDDTLNSIENFEIIKSTIKSLITSGLISRMSGNCIGACEIIGNMLYQKGIKSYMIETQLTLTAPTGDTHLIGYDNFLSPTDDYSTQIDTHTVLIVTLSDTQLLIDPSISYILDSKHPVVIERVNGNTPEIISEYELTGSKLVYTTKTVSKLPLLTQQNLLSNILREDKNSKKLNTLFMYVYATVILSIINALFNIILLLIK